MIIEDINKILAEKVMKMEYYIKDTTRIDHFQVDHYRPLEGYGKWGVILYENWNPFSNLAHAMACLEQFEGYEIYKKPSVRVTEYTVEIYPSNTKEIGERMQPLSQVICYAILRTIK